MIAWMLPWGLMGRMLFLCCALAIAGCAETQGRFTIEVRSPDVGNASTRLVTYGTALRGTDRYAIALTVREPLYLYVEQRSGEGIAPLLPSAGTTLDLVHPGVALQIPHDGFLKLGAQHGDVFVYVVASNQPLSVDLARLEVDKAASGGDSASGRDVSVSGELDSRGIGIIRFKLVRR
jgi:hypothetical protein